MSRLLGLLLASTPPGPAFLPSGTQDRGAGPGCREEGRRGRARRVDAGKAGRGGPVGHRPHGLMCLHSGASLRPAHRGPCLWTDFCAQAQQAHDMLSPGGLKEVEALEAGEQNRPNVLGPAAETPCATVSSSVKWGHWGTSGQTRPCTQMHPKDPWCRVTARSPGSIKGPRPGRGHGRRLTSVPGSGRGPSCPHQSPAAPSSFLFFLFFILPAECLPAGHPISFLVCGE